MIEIKYEEYPPGMSLEHLANLNCDVYGSLCRWTTRGRWRGLPIEDPLADDEEAWAESGRIEGHFVDLADLDFGWFTVLIWVHNNS